MFPGNHDTLHPRGNCAANIVCDSKCKLAYITKSTSKGSSSVESADRRGSDPYLPRRI